VNEFAAAFEDGDAKTGQPIRLGDAIGHIAEKDCNIVVGIRPGIAARAIRTTRRLRRSP
jgi:hypothetical protein